MPAIKQMIAELKKQVDVDEFLQKELGRAGYGGVEITKTPLGTRVTVYVVKPGVVIGRGGGAIRDLSRNIEEKFGLSNPQIAVAEVSVPELNPQIMALKIASALEREVHFRRACYWALNSIMNAGAMGAEIILSGKLSTERSRREKFRAGYLPKVGDPVLKNVLKSVVHTQLKPGLFGIQVKIVPPNYKSPDQFEIKEVPAEEAKPKPEKVSGAVETLKATETSVEAEPEG